jgi:heptosyltransferase-3
VSKAPETERLVQAPAPDADLLVVIVARIGDTLLVTPMLRALKEASPRGTLTVLAHPKRVEVLKHLPFIDRLGTIKPKSAWLRGRLGGKRFAIAFVFGHDSSLVRYGQRLSARVVAFGDGAPATDAARCILVSRPRTPIHAVRERLMLAEAAGITARNLRLTYVVTDAERQWAVHWLAKAFPAAGPVVGLQMVSFPTKAHRNWPAQSFGALAERILARHPAASFVVLGDREARTGAAELSRRAPGKVRVVAGELSLRESAALIAELDLYVGVDTGPTHIAGALEVPMIGIYHHAYPGRYLAPLNRARCRVLEQPAVGELSVDEVMSEVESLFSERGH